MKKCIALASATLLCAAAFGQAQAHYTRLEYIESSGSRYINTGYKPSKDTRTLIDYQILRSAPASQDRVFGVDNRNISYSLYVGVSGKNYWAYAFKDDDGQWQNENKKADTARHVFDFNHDNHRLTIDDGAVWDTTLNNTPTKTATSPLLLGARYNGTKGAQNITPHRIYSCKMWEGDRLVRDYVPAAQNGVTGLWDRVEGKLYGSAVSAAYTGAGEAEPTADDTNMLHVATSYQALSSPTPFYGTHCGYVAGEEVEVSCPAAWTNAAKTAGAVCTGWKLYNAAGEELASGTELAFTYVHPTPAAYRRLEWQWEATYKVTAAANAGGTVAPAEQWVAAGQTATVTATPAAGRAFYKWTNDVPASVSALSPAISFPVTAPVSLFATFAGVFYVKEDGDNANGGTAWDDAFATLERAYTNAVDGTTIHIAAGTYAMTDKITITNDVFILGAGPEATHLNCANAGGRPFTFSSGANARLEGVCIYNGNGASGEPGGGIYMACGTVANCTISNCTGRVPNTVSGAGGIYMSNGTVTNCLITWCTSYLTNNGYPQGSGIAQHGGLVTDCRFVANRAPGYQIGVGIYIDKGVCERSVFTGHTQGVPIYNAGGTVRNCLVYGNTTAGTPASFPSCKRYGGVYQSKGSLYNCTIVGNHSGKGVGGVQAEGGNVVNNIIYGNTSDDTTVGYYFSGTGAFNTNLLDTATEAGVGNFSFDPCFVDAGQNDYHLARRSLAINKGAPLAGVTCDLDGASRPFGPAPEIGCYEYTTAATELTCLINALLTEYCVGEAFSIDSVVEGPDLAGLAYVWSLDGAAFATGSDLSACAFPGTLAPGRHTIALAVSNGAGASAADSVVVSVLPLTTYVAETGDDEANFPYNTPENPAATFSAALAAVWKSSSTTSQVFLAEGTYALGDPVSLTQPVKIAGADARTTILDCEGVAGRAFYLDHADAEVRGLTIAHARPSISGTPGGAFHLVRGTVASCTVTNCSGYTLSGGGIYMTGGLVTNCLITRCQVTRGSQSGYNKGEGVYMTGGRVSGCTFVANNASTHYSNGQGLQMDEGGTVENCVFTGHAATPLMFSAGTVRNCLVYGNRATTADNESYRKTGGVFMEGGRLYNCTIVTNRNASSTKGSAGLRMTGGRAVNNIIWGNASEDGSPGVTIAAGSTFTTNLVDAAISSEGMEVGTVIWASSPFKRVEAGDYRLAGGSRAIGIGDNAIWAGVANATDIAGNPRIIPRRGGVVDAGCYEAPPPAATVLSVK